NRMKFVATKDTILYAFTLQQLFDLVRDDFELFDELMYVVHISFAQLGHRASIAGVHSSSKRILLWLTKLCEVHEPDEQGVYDIECTITLQALSDILYVHITTCSKLMTALEVQGIVERTKGHLLVKDYAKLLAYRNEENPVLY
ncbi:MAG: helix-turn-helix domain-containing protein, partial [Raoultibacter sp.]